VLSGFKGLLGGELRCDAIFIEDGFDDLEPETDRTRLIVDLVIWAVEDRP
jgi:hypothetical protein